MNRTQSLLGERARCEGERWANEMMTRLRGESRRAAGGWPGTVSEARARVELHLLPGLGREGSLALSRADREDAAQRVYRSARELWARMRDPEAEEEQP